MSSAATNSASTSTKPPAAPAATRALLSALAVSGQYAAAGAMYADIVDTDLDDAAYEQWHQAFCDLLAVFLGPTRLPAARWLCWVSGCRVVGTKPGDVGRHKGHWEHHDECNAVGYDSTPGRRLLVENWRLLEDLRENGGNAAREATATAEVLVFSERDRETRELRA